MKGPRYGAQKLAAKENGYRGKGTWMMVNGPMREKETCSGFKNKKSWGGRES